MFPYCERLVCLLLANTLSHPSPRTPHSEVLNLGIIPLHEKSVVQQCQFLLHLIAKFFVAKIFAITFASIKLMLYLCPKIANYGESVSVWRTC